MENEKSPHVGHRRRLRGRFIQEGLKSFEPHNALELLLFYALPRGDTNVLAHRLIEEFGSISGVFDASAESLMNVRGVGESTAALLRLIPELFSLYERDKYGNECLVLNSAELAGKYFISRFIGETAEKVLAVCMDNTCRVKKSFVVSEGALSFADIDIRRLVGTVLNSNASCILLAHNHPSGAAAPSASDIDATRNLVLTLRKLDIRVNDHLIVAGKEYFSMAGSGRFRFLF